MLQSQYSSLPLNGCRAQDPFRFITGNMLGGVYKQIKILVIYQTIKFWDIPHGI